MADELELTEDRIQFDKDVDIKHIQEKATKFDKGAPGDCFLCGEEFSRVVLVENKDGEFIKACGGCRDKHGLK